MDIIIKEQRWLCLKAQRKKQEKSKAKQSKAKAAS